MRISSTVLKILDTLSSKENKFVASDILQENLVKETAEAYLIPVISCYGYKYSLAEEGLARCVDQKTAELMFEFKKVGTPDNPGWSISYASPNAVKRFRILQTGGNLCP
jgi:hypothetical protein